MTRESCNETSDCTILNDNNEAIERLCFAEMFGVDQRDFCDCNPLTGLTGDFCDEFSAQSVIFLLLHLSQLIVSLLGLLFAFFLVYLATEEWKISKGERKKSLINILLTLLCISLGFLVEIIGTSGDLQTLFTPESLVVVDIVFRTGNNEGVLTSGLRGFGLILGLTASLYFFAYSNLLIVVSWLKVTRNASKNINEKTVKRINNIQKFVFTSVVLFSFLALIFSLMLDFELLAMSTFLLLIMMITVTIRGRIEFINALRAMRDSEQKKKILTKIRDFSKKFVIFAISLAVTLPMLSLFSDRLLKYPPGDINWDFNFFVLLFVIKSCFLVYSSHFIHGILKNFSGSRV